MRASVEAGGRSRSQYSQLGRSASAMAFPQSTGGAASVTRMSGKRNQELCPRLSRSRHEQPIAPILDLRGGDDAGDRTAAVEAEAVVLEDVRVGIAGHRPMLGRRRMAM